MIVRLDIESHLSGEFEFDENSFRVGDGPIGEFQRKALGIVNVTHRLGGYAIDDSVLGLYEFSDEEELVTHLWEARRDGGKYTLVYVGDALDYLLKADDDDLWVDWVRDILPPNYETLSKPDLPEWMNVLNYVDSPDIFIWPQTRAIVSRAGEILKVRDLGEAGKDLSWHISRH